jgi:predicted ATPase
VRITSLGVTNFRAISRAEAGDLEDVVVVAGPNGCGKSCLFDAIRLLKSAYGGYNANEWQQWFGEFQISLDRPQPELISLFRDRTRPLTITATVTLAQAEKDFLLANATELLRPLIWRDVAPGRERPVYGRGATVAAQLRSHGAQVERRLDDELTALRADLGKPNHAAELSIDPALTITVRESPTLQLVYSLFIPEHVGIIDYHSAQRSYQLEKVGNINLSIESTEQHYSQHALYNLQAKYQNIKSHMAAGYIRDLITTQAGQQLDRRTSLVDTLQELFRLFFPDKEFLGPRPTQDGRLLFPVRTATGAEHDINDLSSGEKEVLYGYLRIRNVAARRSVLLLDEPELHLNPRLIRGLPQFYHKHLGKALDNQIWLLTHSDALLKEALGREGFSVFHMLAATTALGQDNQLQRVNQDGAIDRAIMDLAGEVSAYQPGAKVVVFEGGGDSQFDLGMTCDLFPIFPTRVNAFSGTNKGKVRELHRLLQEAAAAGALKGRFYSIVDRDSDLVPAPTPARALQWDVYHIENYLLEAQFVLAALYEALRHRNRLTTPEQVLDSLRDSARATVGTLVNDQLTRWAHDLLSGAIGVGSNPRSASQAEELVRSVEGSAARLNQVRADSLNLHKIAEREAELRAMYSRDLETGQWVANFRGRDILRHFAGQHAGGIGYETLRNLIIARMRDAGYEPPGMKAIIQRILDD